MKRTPAIISTLIILALAAGGIFFYITRPLAAPTEDLTQTPSTTSSGSTPVFALDSEQTTATFEIFEVLSGQDKIVVGTTNQVGGSVTIDTENPSNSMVQPIRINARTFITDSDRRNSAIGRLILKSEEPANEFITFTPTSVAGLPSSGERNTNYTFTVTGDLTISGVTKETTFAVEAMLTDTNEIKGTATSSLQRGDFNLVVPSLPFLADVAEEVKLKLEFVAR